MGRNAESEKKGGASLRRMAYTGCHHRSGIGPYDLARPARDPDHLCSGVETAKEQQTLH